MLASAAKAQDGSAMSQGSRRRPNRRNEGKIFKAKRLVHPDRPGLDCEGGTDGFLTGDWRTGVVKDVSEPSRFLVLAKQSGWLRIIVPKRAIASVHPDGGFRTKLIRSMKRMALA